MKAKTAFALFGVAFSFMAFASVARADGLPETCPASIVMPALDIAATGNEFGFALEAPGGRLVEGNILVWTDRGWYTIAFPKAQLTSRTLHSANIASGKPSGFRETFLSPVMFVRFPQRVTLKSAFVIDARSFDDNAGWAAQGDVSCALDAALPTTVPLPSQASALSPPDALPFNTLPASDGDLLSARPTEQFGDDSCPVPFVDARATTAVPPDSPGDLGGGTSLVELLIAPNGTVVRASLYRSSGVAAYDDSALRAARQSTYAPKIAYCRPMYGRYFYRIDFH